MELRNPLGSKKKARGNKPSGIRFIATTGYGEANDSATATRKKHLSFGLRPPFSVQTRAGETG